MWTVVYSCCDCQGSGIVEWEDEDGTEGSNPCDCGVRTWVGRPLYADLLIAMLVVWAIGLVVNGLMN